MKIAAAARGQSTLLKNKIPISKRLSWLFNAKTLLWTIIILGILLRFTLFLNDRALWLDEARLALNIVHRSFTGLTEPLDYDQGAPLGFLLIEKLNITILGNNEYALRLFPFLCGIAALFLFYRVSTYFVSRRAALLAMGLFAVSKYLITYSAEVKQYSTDVAVTLILLLMFIELQSNKLSWGRILLFGLTGAGALWLSHAALFVLASIASGLLLSAFLKTDWPRLIRLCLVFVVWAASFIPLYLISLAKLSNHTGLLMYWDENFMPLPPRSFSDLLWLVDAFFNLFKNPVGLELAGVGAFAFCVGCLSMALINRKYLYILIAPIGLTLLASGFHLYPFGDRLLLFGVPAMLLLIAQGIDYLQIKAGPLVSLSLMALIFIFPVQDGVQTLMSRTGNEEIKPVMAYLNTHYQTGDVIYLYYGAHEAYMYYQTPYGLVDKPYVIGHDFRDTQLGDYTAELDQLRGHQRVWVLFSHVFKGFDEKKFFLYYLDAIGHRVDSFGNKDVSLYLYNLGNEH